MGDKRLQEPRRWHRVTRDMLGLYEGAGFSRLSEPGRHMQKHDPDVYRRVDTAPA